MKRSSSMPLAPSRAQSAEASRFERFERLLAATPLSIDALRELSWSGVPAEIRPITWQLLSGYLPANADRRETTLQRKRAEYDQLIDQYYDTRLEEGRNSKIFHQITVDIPRTNPAPVFQLESVGQMMARVLYIWSIRHPGSDYVQGMNDLVTPFFSVFVSPHIEYADIEKLDVLDVPEDTLREVEADCYWCLTKLLDSLHDNYIAAQPGIQTRISALSDLVGRIDAPLRAHLQAHNVDFLTFTFRWMNCLLLRELPLSCTVRLWDTYHAEVDGFAQFHLYACAAFLTTFSKQLLAAPDMAELLMLLQCLPTTEWTESNVALLLAEAYRWKYMFHDAQKHLK